MNKTPPLPILKKRAHTQIYSTLVLHCSLNHRSDSMSLEVLEVLEVLELEGKEKEVDPALRLW